MSQTYTSSRRRDVKLKILPPILVFLGVFALYAATAAPGTLFGDPSEYQFIPAILGIAHPPGYAFYTLLAKLWQLLVPVGTIAFRTNLLASAVGAWTVTAVYLITREVGLGGGWDARGPVNVTRESARPRSTRLLIVAPVFAALALAAAPDLWQHAIHANAHIVSAALTTTHLWFLARWWRTARDGWLAAFAVALGLAATHHPITLMGVPAYALFILAVRPRILVEWRILLPVAGCLLLGLSPLLYYPLRSPDVPFGPTNMNTWEGFLNHVTARGLRVNLFHFGVADQPDRALVFWSLLRLQFLLPVILIAPLGLIALTRRTAKPALLVGGFLLGHLAFTLNTVQDVMAYLLLPFAALAVLAGVGALALGTWAWRAVEAKRQGARRRALAFDLLLALLILPWPFVRAGQNLSRGISLRDFTVAEAWVDAVHRRFGGQKEGAALLAAWEYLTPLWVHAYTEDQKLDPEDAELVYVSTATPWAETAWNHIEAQPVYLPDYRPTVRHAGFRLVPDGAFYKVERPPVTDARPSRRLDLWVDGRVRILGYDLPKTTVRAGKPLTLVVYQSAPEPVGGIWMPYAQLGPVEDRWTTDSRLLTTEWQPGETVAERYEVLVPFDLPPGDYPLRLGYADLTGGRAELPLSTGGATVTLDTVTVLRRDDDPSAGVLRRSLANLDNQVALMGARVRGDGGSHRAFWDEPAVVHAGGTFHLTLRWRALASPRDSATVFIHLIDDAERPVAGWDYTPLGGSAPTYLWFPKWLPGQTFVDPYRLTLPHDLLPGDYRLEVGMYGMTSHRRLPVVDASGDLAGDRVILGPVRVE
jgi:hypothetical protein